MTRLDKEAEQIFFMVVKTRSERLPSDEHDIRRIADYLAAFRDAALEEAVDECSDFICALEGRGRDVCMTTLMDMQKKIRALKIYQENLSGKAIKIGDGK